MPGTAKRGSPRGFHGRPKRIQHVIVNLPNAHELTPLEIFGREVIPVAAEL